MKDDLGSQTSQGPLHPEAWTGDCVDFLLHPEDQVQLLQDVFAGNPSRQNNKIDRIRKGTLDGAGKAQKKVRSCIHVYTFHTTLVITKDWKR